jgi:putative endonuclease
MAKARDGGRTELGRRGEGLAARWLERRGYRVLARNWRRGRFELDLVCRAPGPDPPVLVVVEVKTRRQDAEAFGREALSGERPELAVGARKQRHLAAAGRAFLAAWPGPAELRFDLVAIRVHGGRARLRHLPDAFFPGA